MDGFLASGPKCMRLHFLMFRISAQEPHKTWLVGTADCWLTTTKPFNPNNCRLNQNACSEISQQSQMAPFGLCFGFLLTEEFAEYLIDEASYTTVPSPPFDSISSIRYSPTNPDQLLLSSWDTVCYFASFLLTETAEIFYRQCGSMTLARVASGKARWRPSLIIGRLYLHVRSRRMHLGRTVVVWILLSGSE